MVAHLATIEEATRGGRDSERCSVYGCLRHHLKIPNRVVLVLHVLSQIRRVQAGWGQYQEHSRPKLRQDSTDEEARLPVCHRMVPAGLLRMQILLGESTLRADVQRWQGFWVLRPSL